MFDRDALAALSAVLDTGSFDAAAARLRISQPAVSARIKALEEQVGAVLIRRTRPASATEQGRRLQAHAETLVLEEQSVARELGLRPGRSDRPLRIAVTADTLASGIAAALPQEPWLYYDLVIDDQDHSLDLLARGEVAAAITAKGGYLPGCDSTYIGTLPYAAFASAAFVENYFPGGVTRDNVLLAPAITFNRKDKLQLNWASKVAGVPLRELSTHYIGSTQGITDAARLGLGWAVNPANLVQPFFDSGELVRLRPDITLETKLYWQVPRQNEAALADLMGNLKKVARGWG